MPDDTFPDTLSGQAGGTPQPLQGDTVVPEEFEDESLEWGKKDRPADVPGGQERTLTEDEKLDESLEETFPTSDPIQPSRIDGPNN